MSDLKALKSKCYDMLDAFIRANLLTADESLLLKHATRLDIPPHFPSPHAAAQPPFRDVYTALVEERIPLCDLASVVLDGMLQAAESPAPYDGMQNIHTMMIWGSDEDQPEGMLHALERCSFFSSLRVPGKRITYRGWAVPVDSPEFREAWLMDVLTGIIADEYKIRRNALQNNSMRPAARILDPVADWEKANKGSSKSYWS